MDSRRSPDYNIIRSCAASIISLRRRIIMKLTIGQTIRSLRRERGITQEDLAEMLGVACQSVSRWELGSCYPDIELLPVIADIFQISTDKLLGADYATEQKKTDEYLTRFQTAISQGQIDRCIDIAREGIAEFPNNYTLLNKLMYALFVSGDDSGNIPNWKENREKYDAEIVSLGERIMKYCPDPDIRLEAVGRLAFQHCEMGRKNMGRVLYETLPSQELCRENQIWWALEQEEKLPFLQKKIRQDYESLRSAVWQLAGSRLLPDNESIKVFQKIAALEHLICDGPKTPDTWGPMHISYELALLHARTGNAQEACRYLKTAAQNARVFDDRPETLTISSLLLGTVTENKIDFDTADTRSYCRVMAEDWLTAQEFDILRDTEEFQKIVEMLNEAD